MLALVDCNNFYVSCERAFQPQLNGKPVVVLSNNDGCVIARSNEAKDLGIPMGQPVHEMWPMAKRYGITAFSSNYTLYGDMSPRVARTLEHFSDMVEVYSIDEAFVSLEGCEQRGLHAYGQQIRDTVLQWTYIPTSIGIGPSKTLCKVAAEHAKKLKTGVVDLTDQDAQAAYLALTPIGDVWGVGHQYQKKLESIGIHTALDLRDCSDVLTLINNVNMMRTVCELRGESCIPLEEMEPLRKGIMTSRAFGYPLQDLATIREAMAKYTARACHKMRKHGLASRHVQIFLQTNRYQVRKRQRHQGASITLPVATNCTHEASKYILPALERIYESGYEYHKCGVMFCELVPEEQMQQNLFDSIDRTKQKQLMTTLDAINASFGPGTLRYAAEGKARVPQWGTRANHRSKRYTTNLNELWEVS